MNKEEPQSNAAGGASALTAGLGVTVTTEMAKVGELAIAADVARTDRARARTHLSKLRRKWMEDYDDFYDREQHRGEEGAADMEAAIQAREAANRALRLASGRLRAAIKRVTPNAI